MSSTQDSSEFYEVYKKTVTALAETWILDSIAAMSPSPNKQQTAAADATVVFEWDPSDAFFVDTETDNVVIVQKDGDQITEFSYDVKTKAVTETPITCQVIYPKATTFNVGRALKTKTFREYIIKRINDLNLNAFVTVNHAGNNVTIVPRKYTGTISKPYSHYNNTREMPKICDYITTKSAVKLLKNQIAPRKD